VTTEAPCTGHRTPRPSVHEPWAGHRKAPPV